MAKMAASLSISQPQAPAGKPVAYVTVFARGLVKHQFTAVFLEDDPALAQSALLEQVPADRRHTCSPASKPMAVTCGISTCRARARRYSSTTPERLAA
jgi:protocatechuate 3,4-dioxygenase beta subunit